MGIDNCLIQVTGPEMPIMDGSSLNFIEMFVWLSASMSAVSHSQVDVDEQVALPPIGWGSV
jgi:UDP-3-O-acyl-N-acetylglucosamine deacetylase